MLIKLEKLEEFPNTIYPHNVEVGHVKKGKFIREPTLGEPFWVGFDFRTSTVTEIINENTFRTKNSIYRWTKLQ